MDSVPEQASPLCAAQNFIAIAVFVADGLYNFLKIGILSLQVCGHRPSLSCQSCSSRPSFCLLGGNLVDDRASCLRSLTALNTPGGQCKRAFFLV